MRIKSNFTIALSVLLFTCACSKDANTTIAPPPEVVNRERPISIILKDIPASTFTMGSTTDAGDAATVSITLTAFKISEKEITNQQYIDFLNNAYLDGWIIVSSQTASDPCGTLY